MKALIYKELKLAMHPICYLFVFLFPLMVFIPNFPLGIGFIYILTNYPVLFLGANKGQQSNDLLYSTLLPVRKKDIVLARMIIVLLMQIAFILVMSTLYPLEYYIQSTVRAMNPDQPNLFVNAGLSIDSYVLCVAIAVVGYAIADLIFFPIYYKQGKSIVMSTLLTIFGFVLFIGLFTIILPYIPGFEFMNKQSIGVQFICLGAAIGISILIHILVYKISSKRLEKVDF